MLLHNHCVQMQLIDPREKTCCRAFRFFSFQDFNSVSCSLSLHFWTPLFSSLHVSRWISWLEARTDFQISRFDFWHFSAAAVGAFLPSTSLTSRTRSISQAAFHSALQSALLHSVHCCTPSSPECTPGHYTAHQFTTLYITTLHTSLLFCTLQY